jgi:ribosomal protein L16 Arg81 hydroxylase
MKNIVDELTRHHFFDDYYEKKSLYIPGVLRDPQFFANNLARVDDLFNRPLKSSQVRIVKKDSIIAPEAYCQKILGKRKFAGTRRDDLSVDVRKVAEYYTKGYTVVFQDIGFDIPEFARCILKLEEYFASSLYANAYFSPKNSQGLPLHCDEDDVLILQLRGSKEWYVTDDLSSSAESHDGRSSYTWEGRLKPGDILYIPGGHRHFAKTNEDHYVHITLGIKPPYLADFVRFISDRILSSNKIFTGSFVQQLITSQENIGKNLRYIAQEFSGKLSDDVFLISCFEEFKLQILRNRSRRLDFLSVSFKDICSLNEVNEHSRICVSNDSIYCLKTYDDIHFLILGENKIDIPSSLKDFLDCAFSGEDFSIACSPGNFSTEKKIELVKKFVANGFLVIKKL